MKLYLAVSSGGTVSENPAERAATMSELNRWYDSLGESLEDSGAALTGKAKTVTSDGDVVEDASPLVANGYLVLKAETLDDAVALVQGYPLLDRGYDLSVMETYKQVPATVTTG
jgi:hypothetical protein